MVVLLLVEWPLHPLTLGQTFSVKPSTEEGAQSFKRDEKALRTRRRSLNGAESCRPLLRSEPSLVASSNCSSLFTTGEMFVDDRIWTLFKRNAHHTLTYWSVFFSFGLCIAFLGPTILDLQCQTNSTLSQITWVFFSQQFCLLIGSSVGGVFKRTWVFRRVGEGSSSILYWQVEKTHHLNATSPSTFRLFSALSALFVSALIISVIFAIIPLCYNVLVLAIAMAVSGLAMGIIDTIANIQLVTIYQKDSAVFLQVKRKTRLKPVLNFLEGFFGPNRPARVRLCRLSTSSLGSEPWWARWLLIPSYQRRAAGTTQPTALRSFITSEACSETAPSPTTT